MPLPAIKHSCKYTTTTINDRSCLKIQYGKKIIPNIQTMNVEQLGICTYFWFVLEKWYLGTHDHGKRLLVFIS